MSRAGGALIGLLSELRGGGTGESIAEVDLSGLRGRDVHYAVQQIVQVLTPGNGDADRIRTAMQHALSSAVEGMDDFDPAAIADATLVDTLVVYLSDAVFQQIVMDSDRAFQKSSSPEEIVNAERGLHELVRSAVDKQLRPLLGEEIGIMTAKQIANVQQRAVQEVWREWEANE